MIENLIIFFAGLFIGWFFLPIPTFAQSLLNKLLSAVPGLSRFLRK